MLNYFPNPYPDEWFYSILCRYHIRSGNQHFQSTIKELGIGTNNVGSIYPNNAVAKLVKNLPNGLFEVEDLILNHTLFSYYTRFYCLSEKQEMLNKLCEGDSDLVQ